MTTGSTMDSADNDSSSPRPARPGAIRVLVVDDQALIRRGLALMLDLEPDVEVIGQAADGAEAVLLARLHRPDVVLMDLRMPRMDGVAATRTITADLPEVQIVVLTTFDSDELVFDAVRAGAQAYLLKDADEQELLETVRAVRRGESRLDPYIARKVMQEFRRIPAPASDASPPENQARPGSQPSPEPDADDSRDALNKREEQILSLVANGLSNKEIARTVSLAEGTVKNYISRIMEKLRARTRTELAVKAVQNRR